MSSSLSAVDSESTLLEAFEVAESRNLKALLVVSDGETCGVITSQDIARQVVADEDAASRRQVREVMSRRIAACYEDSDVQQTRALIKKSKIDHILVCRRDKKIVGFTTAADLL